MASHRSNYWPGLTQDTIANTPTQNGNGYDSQDDSGDDLFLEHATIPTQILDRPLQNGLRHASPSHNDMYTTQSQGATPPRLHTPPAVDPSGSVVQVPASSPFQAPQTSSVPSFNEGALNRGFASSIMAPPGTTIRAPIVQQRKPPQSAQAKNDNASILVVSDSSDDENATLSDIRPTVFTKGGNPLNGVHSAVSNSNSAGARPEVFANLAASFGFDANRPSQKRPADEMASAYGGRSRPPKAPKQNIPAKAEPVESKKREMTLDEIYDAGLKRKISDMLMTLPDNSVRSCHDALLKCRGNADMAMSILVEAEERRREQEKREKRRLQAIDLTNDADELSHREIARSLKPAKRKVDAPSRTITEKWTSTQNHPRPQPSSSPATSSTAARPQTPPDSLRRKGNIIRRKKPDLTPGQFSSPDPITRATAPRARVVVSDDEDDSGTESASQSDSAQHAVSGGQDSDFFTFLNTCTARDLADLSSQSMEVVELVISKRPFASFDDIRAITTESSSTTKTGKTRTVKRPVGERLLEACEEMWAGYAAVDQLVSNCEELGKPIAAEMKKWGFDAFGSAHNGEMQLLDLDATSAHDSGIGTPSSAAASDAEGDSRRSGKDKKQHFLQQPKVMSKDLVMKDYQVAGLNWLALLFSKRLSCILADDMGLGKTCQVIAFLAHLYEIGISGPHVVVVPGSTLENWLREFQNFCPALRVEPYYGMQDERAEHRLRLEDDIKHINVIVTTYDMASKPKDAQFLRRTIQPVVCVYDEGHALKNSQSKRYKELMRIPAQFRLLLTGTPLQNNLQELISLLAFIMPGLFRTAQEDLEYIFKHKAKTTDKDHAALLSAERISRARSMMTPFILRRKKHQVLKHLPQKVRRVEKCELVPAQKTIYDGLVTQVQKILSDREAGLPHDSKEKINILMRLRQAAIHPLLFRTIFDDKKLRKMSVECLKEPRYAESNAELVFEDMSVMTDWELHQFCCDNPKTMSRYALKKKEWMDSGKVKALVDLLQKHQANGDRTLIFSQFTMVMNILEEVFETIGMPFFRLDGSTRMNERQDMIDMFYKDTSIPIFMLSTRAGGAGINLACANKVIIFDSSFNPQEDVQAENRAHRVGQVRDVEVVKLISQGTVEEQIHALGESKLALDERVAGEGGAGTLTPNTSDVKAEEEGLRILEKMLFDQPNGASGGSNDAAPTSELESPQSPSAHQSPQSLAHRGKEQPTTQPDLKDAFLHGLRAAGLDVSAA